MLAKNSSTPIVSLPPMKLSPMCVAISLLLAASLLLTSCAGSRAVAVSCPPEPTYPLSKLPVPGHFRQLTGEALNPPDPTAEFDPTDKLYALADEADDVLASCRYLHQVVHGFPSAR